MTVSLLKIIYYTKCRALQESGYEITLNVADRRPLRRDTIASRDRFRPLNYKALMVWVVPKTRGRGAGCGVRGAGCGVRGAGCGVRGAGCGVRGAGCGVRGAGCGVRGADCGVIIIFRFF